ncbi:pilus assembly PilX N-terminal domain-containing protein [Photobacterium phosphoreum]|uniref:pilus assembly PilX N-terminal domain-containing protein n=1 Tax=Photobacterium phosphoreum TaxID=659 RepID=UPI001E5763CF|nr:pilus assembly PilX N-terminal domain-containing protein [Photobacterium phosphoreum]MCD9511296.1 MSHA biogenesis protein MshP [Photobacterium phosphoreum]
MRRNSAVSLRSQTGSALVVAIFIITVMSMMAAAMIKINASQTVTTTQEILGTRAWFAAHSGIEISLNKLFPIGDPNQMLTCDVISHQIPLVDFDGCKVSVECDEFVANDDAAVDAKRRIQLRSTGRCGSGQYQVARQQQVWVKGLAQ